MGWLNLWAAAAAAFGQTTAPQPVSTWAPPPSPTAAPTARLAPAPAGTIVAAPSATVVAAPNGTVYTYGSSSGCGCASDNCGNVDCGCGRSRFEGDHAFDGFIGPISAPIFSKDP